MREVWRIPIPENRLCSHIAPALSLEYALKYVEVEVLERDTPRLRREAMGEGGVDCI
jgi:hypothetical protein